MEMLFEGLSIILCIQLTVMSGQHLNQSPQVLSIQEGQDVSMNCSYSNTFNTMLWYKQGPGESLILLLALYKTGEFIRNGKLTAQFSGTRKDSFLTLSASSPGDTGTYLCAGQLRGGNYKVEFGKGTLLIVHPNIRNPEPSVYQMKDPKFRNTSICLFTDFDSQINVTQGSEAMDSEVFYSGKTVLDMRSIDFKSNGAVAWSKKTDFECTGVFQEKVSLPSSDHSCNAKLVEKSFETDMNLNFQNLIVIGLRILLLKVAGYNVFMTLRLWSS